jgi:hypothetical protein
MTNKKTNTGVLRCAQNDDQNKSNDNCNCNDKGWPGRELHSTHHDGTAMDGASGRCDRMERAGKQGAKTEADPCGMTNKKADFGEIKIGDSDRKIGNGDRF